MIRFNGAATFRLRKGNHGTPAPSRVGRFNGAATFRLRKGRPLAGPRMGASCFNGAATFRLRKEHNARAVFIRQGTASMGPQPFGCGRYHVDEVGEFPVAASMGPQPFGCGRGRTARPGARRPGRFNGAATFRLRKAGHSPAPHFGVSELQWGRNLSVAEGSMTALKSKLILRFNGAATFRLRKGAPRPRARPRPRASMGPQPFGCGRDRHPGRPAGGGAASMGPQPFGCGRTLTVAKAYPGRPLQWGRNLSVAEGEGGGAQKESARVASMGPQPFGCGRSLMPRVRSPCPMLQWGRNLSVAEGELGQCNHLVVPGFNGAATFRLRKATRGRPQGRLAERFNGAATFRLRKARCVGVTVSAAQRQWGRNLSVAEGKKCQ